MKNNNLEQRMFYLEQKIIDLEKKLLDITNPNNNNNNNNLQKVGKKLSLKEFLLGKKVSDDVKKTLAIAYFIEYIENIRPFNTDDLKKAFFLAKEKSPVNLNDKINMNIRNGLIMEAEEKKESKKAWVLTATGEVFVKKTLNK